MKVCIYTQEGREVLRIEAEKGLGPDNGRKMLRCLAPTVVNPHKGVVEQFGPPEGPFDVHILMWREPYGDQPGYWAH